MTVLGTPFRWEPVADLYYAATIGWGGVGQQTWGGWDPVSGAWDHYHTTALPFGRCSLHGDWDTNRYLACPGCSTSAPVQFRVYPPLPEVPPVMEMVFEGAERPHRCPVCMGRSKVPAGFYTNGLSSDTADVPCRSCENGIVWH